MHLKNKEEGSNVSHDPKEEQIDINHNVEVLNIGSVAFGKLWCNKQVIFSKGIVVVNR